MEGTDVFFVGGEVAPLRLVDVEDLLVVTVVLQDVDVVKLVTAAWHKLTWYANKNAKTALTMSFLCINLISLVAECHTRVGLFHL